MRTSLGESNNGKDIIQRTEVMSTSDRNGRVPKTEVFKSNNDLVERTTFLEPGQGVNSSDRNGRVRETEVFKGAKDNDLVERAQFVRDDDPEIALFMDEINDLVQSLGGLTQYLPLLSVVTEVHSPTPLLVHRSWNSTC
jgi:hypothetical protein